ncbi:MAG: DMT family transporter [Tissierellia bacterium]|nr:DMT family transporter [Tissierellia bacterium]
MEKNQNIRKGTIFMLTSSLFFALMQMSVKFTGGRIPVFEQVFFRNLITLILCGFLVKKNGERFFGTKESRPWLFLRSILGYLGVVAYFYCINHMPTADATILQKSSPIFVMIFALFFLKESLTKTKLAVLILSFIGAMFVVRPEFNSRVFPALVGLGSAAFAGGAYTTLSYVNKMEKTNTIIFFFSLVSSLLSLPLMLSNFVMPTAMEFFVLLSIGIFAGLAQITLTLGYKYAPASEVSIYTYGTIVFAAIFGYFLFQDKISPMTMIGILLIFGAQYYSFYHNRKLARIKKQYN